MSGTDEAIDRCGAFVAFVPDAPAGAGPLADLRMAVKDNIAVAGLPFTAGHPLFADRVAETDAAVVRRLREAGARIVGVTHTDAGGFGVTTPVVANPVAPGRTVGGSSGGSAAAVAAGLADVALGTDTGGSVRIPAACTGLIGLKPTRGRISIEDGAWHVWPLSPSLDHVGLIGRDLDNIARTLGVLLGPERSSESRPSPNRLRIGIDRAPLVHCHDAVEGAFNRVVQALSAKHDIVQFDWPDRTRVMDAHRTILLFEAREFYSALTSAEVDRLSAAARRALVVADEITSKMLIAARRTGPEIAVAVDTLLQRVDLLLSPTLSCPVPPQDARRVIIRGQSVSVVNALIANTVLFNVSGHPALALPSREMLEGLPFSIQIAGGAAADLALLDCARMLAPVLQFPPDLRN
jgi:Asp-tRNA(Asn)/Glu-tRNA(Gln) amidotransferase A subunit family amidase